MKSLNEKINEERIKSQKLRESAWETEFHRCQEIRKEQQKHWQKFLFLKELRKALEKEGKQNGQFSIK